MGHGVTERRRASGRRAPTGESRRARGVAGARRLLVRRAARSHRSAGVGAAETLLQLAVLLQAGVAPAPAWRHLAAAGDAAAQHVMSAVDGGVPLPEAIATIGTDAWREVGVAYHVAAIVGAPLAECLRALAIALRDAQEAVDDVRVALAEPAGTARLMSRLPLVAVGLGAALGFDTVGTLLTSPLGLACLAGGLVLILVAARWSARLVRAAQNPQGVPGLEAELIAIALSGGVSIDRARAVVGDARRLGVSREAGERDAPREREEPRERELSEGRGARAQAHDSAAANGGVTAGGALAADNGARERDEVDAVLALSRTAGVPAVELLRASAAHARQRSRIEGRLRAARLSSRLLIPLGVCTLPAFLLLGVAPMLLSVMSTMSLSL
jgi:tight adherence protein B